MLWRCCSILETKETLSFLKDVEMEYLIICVLLILVLIFAIIIDFKREDLKEERIKSKKLINDIQYLRDHFHKKSIGLEELLSLEKQRYYGEIEFISNNDAHPERFKIAFAFHQAYAEGIEKGYKEASKSLLQSPQD